jgi:hypothetical protein
MWPITLEYQKPLHHSVERLISTPSDKSFLYHVSEYLKAENFLHHNENFTFVYGDIHDGGWGDIKYNGHNIRIYNCGAWVTHSKNYHPACHIFIVNEEGEEYLFDVSFKDVQVGEDSLLELAAIDAENRLKYK